MFKNIKLNRLLTRVRKDTALVDSGEYFGESVALEFVNNLIKLRPDLEKDLFNIIKDSFGDTFNTENLKDFLKLLDNQWENNNNTVVSLYSFEGNEEGIYIIEKIFDLLNKKLYTKTYYKN